jgi:hypothetical protein
MEVVQKLKFSNNSNVGQAANGTGLSLSQNSVSFVPGAWKTSSIRNFIFYERVACGS